jgi:hypothetical protein
VLLVGGIAAAIGGLIHVWIFLLESAGAVLIPTDRRFLRAAALQVIPGLAAVALLFLA